MMWCWLGSFLLILQGCFREGFTEGGGPPNRVRKMDELDVWLSYERNKSLKKWNKESKLTR
jgi:hypothetical protein